MTTKLEQAARQALEALEEAYAAQFETTWFEIKPEHFTALREVLAEPDIEEMTLTQIAARHEQAEQAPVGEVKILRMNTDDSKFHYVECQHLPEGTKLYAAPVRTKDLTDEEIEWLVVDTLETWNSKDTMKDFARAVIAADREKNK